MKFCQQITNLTNENLLLRAEVHKLTEKLPVDMLRNMKEHDNVHSYADTLKKCSTVIVKPKDDKQSSAKTKSDINTNIDPLRFKLDISKIKNIKNGGVLLNCQNPNELMKIAQQKKTGGIL